MANMIFDTYNDIAEYMIQCDEKCILVSVIAFIKDATEIIRNILMYDIDIGCIDIAQDYIDGYSDEYLISIVGSKLFVEKAFNVERQEYIRDESDILLVCDDCGYDVDDCKTCFHYSIREMCNCDDFKECCVNPEKRCDCDECETENLPTYRIIDDYGNVIGTANITVNIEIED